MAQEQWANSVPPSIDTNGNARSLLERMEQDEYAFLVGRRDRGEELASTIRIFLEFLARLGVEIELCDTTDHEQLEAAIATGCDLVYLETPTNPTLKVMDIARLAAAAQLEEALRWQRTEWRNYRHPTSCWRRSTCDPSSASDRRAKRTACSVSPLCS